jgi:hypothetical protein
MDHKMNRRMEGVGPTSLLLAHMVGTWACLVDTWCLEDTAG